MSEMKLFEQIEDYLKNRMSEAESSAFEAAMASNPDLAKEVALHRDMMVMMEEEEENLVKSPPDRDLLDFRELMEQAYEGFKEEKEEEDLPESKVPLTPAKGGKWYWIIGAVVLLIGLVVWLTQKPVSSEIGTQTPTQNDTIPSAPQKQEPIAQTPLPLPPNVPPPAQDYASLVQKTYADSPYKPGVLMSDNPDEPEDSLLQRAMEAYTQGKFKRTTDLLKILPEEGQTDALKLRAHAWFQLGRYERAAADFEVLVKSISYRSDAEWYLLLCYAAGLPKTRAAYEIQLSKVNRPGHPFEQKAKALKTRLLVK